jgi:hypothetical protein
MDLSRIARPTARDYARIEKYKAAKVVIEKAIAGVVYSGMTTGRSSYPRSDRSRSIFGCGSHTGYPHSRI